MLLSFERSHRISAENLLRVIVHLQVAGLLVELGYDLRDLALDVVELPLDLGKLRNDLRRFVVAAEHQLEQRRASVLEGAPRRLLADEFQAGDQQVDGLDRDVGFGGRVFRAKRGHVLLEVLGGLIIG